MAVSFLIAEVTGMQLPLVANYFDVNGVQLTSIGAVPMWDSSDITVATVVPAADGLSAKAVYTGQAGTTMVTSRVDADLGDGERPIVLSEELTVMAPEAATGTLTAGALEPQA